MNHITTITDRERDLAEKLATAEQQRDAAWGELREIREAIRANPEESTADEARRLASNLQQRDELAAQVEVTRQALTGVARELGIDWLRPEFEEADEALRMPNTAAAAILRQRDARTLREAAAIAVEWGNARKPGQGGHALWNYAEHIRTTADELLAGAQGERNERD